MSTRSITLKNTVGAGSAIANWLNPVTSDPAAPLKSVSFLESFTPSLMPRSSVHQGIAAGTSVLIAELVGRATEGAIRKVVPNSAPFAYRFGARAVATATGLGLR